MGELAIGSNALQWSRGNHEFCSINLESADPDLLQVENQGIELAKDPELLATLGGQGAFGQAVNSLKLELEQLIAQNLEPRTSSL